MSEAANENKPLNTISYYDIDTHLRNLKNSDADKVNHYSALKCFFIFTYNKSNTQDVMSQVTKPTYEKSPNIILDEERYKKLVKFITNRWEVSKLTLESVSTIEQHVNDIDNLMYRQTSILNSF